MIDPAWLRRVIAYADADTGGYEAEHLAMLLDDAAEILPYVMSQAGGFADWPKARAALSKAAGSAPKSAQGKLAASDAPLSEHRPELYEAIREALLASAADPASVAKPPKATVSVVPKDRNELPVSAGIEFEDELDLEPEDAPPTTEDLLHLIKRVRFDEARGSDSPSMFISGGN